MPCIIPLHTYGKYHSSILKLAIFGPLSIHPITRRKWDSVFAAVILRAKQFNTSGIKILLPLPGPFSVMIAFWRYRHLCYTSYLPSSSFCDRSTLYCNYSGLVNKALLLVKSSLFSISKYPKSINQCLKCILSKQKYTLSLENALLGDLIS